MLTNTTRSACDRFIDFPLQPDEDSIRARREEGELGTAFQFLDSDGNEFRLTEDSPSDPIRGPTRRRDPVSRMETCAAFGDSVFLRPRNPVSAGARRARLIGHAAVIVPKSPSASSFGPAVKNSVSIG